MNFPRHFYLFNLLSIATIFASAQPAETIREYVDTYKDLAIAEMQRTGVPASITLAQGIHETTAGTSVLVRKSNNHFGIKCKSNWSGKSVRHDDDARAECFRAYSTPIDSYKDHSDFLKNSARYAALFTLNPIDYEGWAHGLKKAGYATNPKYPQVIIKLIHDYNLQDYTLIALGKNSVEDDRMVKDQQAKEKIGSEIVTAEAMIENEFKPESAKAITEEPVYPAGEFRINETRVVYAKKGIAFLAIAGEYNVPLARIFDFNDMNVTEFVPKDGLIYLQRKRKTGNQEFYTVQAGETLHDIAQKSAIRLESLLEYNYLTNEMRPAIGERLYLKWKSSHQPKLQLRESWTLTPTTKY